MDLLLEAIRRRSGHDFAHYARLSLRRRLEDARERAGVPSLAAMIPLVLESDAFVGDLVTQLALTVTEMFRDPPFFRDLREHVVPALRTWPRVRVWDAGCATGEETWSLAILLQEEGLYDRSQIYATDFNETALAKARDGIYAAANMRRYTQNYLTAGGLADFADYYHARYDTAVVRTGLRSNVTFASHSLVTDAPFGQMHLVLCRNVLVYFDRALQERALQVLHDSLLPHGFLALGARENLLCTPLEGLYEAVTGSLKIYRRIVA